MAEPRITIVEEGPVMSRAISDPSGGMLDEVEGRLRGFLGSLPAEGALVSVSFEARGIVEGVVAVLQEMKVRRDSLLRYQRRVAEMRARLQEEVPQPPNQELSRAKSNEAQKLARSANTFQPYSRKVGQVSASRCLHRRLTKRLLLAA
jgi:hypothetical protein